MHQNTNQWRTCNWHANHWKTSMEENRQHVGVAVLENTWRQPEVSNTLLTNQRDWGGAKKI